jgi:hypothetical protein
MRRALCSAVLTLLMTGGIAHAGAVADERAAADLVTTAMNTLGAKGVRGVFETVAPYWNRSKAELESVISDSEVKRENGRAEYGEYLGFEKIDERKVGASLFMVRVLEKTQKRAVVWYFSFYKPKDSWILWSCYWDPKFESLLLLK